jgi:hypothetical protein
MGIVQTLDFSRQHIDDAKIKSGRSEFDLVPHDFRPFVSGGVDPAD